MSIFVIFSLQNQCTGDELVGGFDSHALPPIIQRTAVSLQPGTSFTPTV